MKCHEAMQRVEAGATAFLPGWPAWLRVRPGGADGIPVCDVLAVKDANGAVVRSVRRHYYPTEDARMSLEWVVEERAS